MSAASAAKTTESTPPEKRTPIDERCEDWSRRMVTALRKQNSSSSETLQSRSEIFPADDCGVLISFGTGGITKSLGNRETGKATSGYATPGIFSVGFEKRLQWTSPGGTSVHSRVGVEAISVGDAFAVVVIKAAPGAIGGEFSATETI